MPGIDEFGGTPLVKDPGEVHRRRIEVVRLRTRGVLWDEVHKQIMAEFGPCSLELLVQDFNFLMQRHSKELKENLESMRQVSLDRLDKAIQLVSNALEAGNLDSVEMLVKLETRRAKLLGLDMPIKTEVTRKSDGKALSPAEILYRIDLIASKIKAKLESGKMPTGMAQNVIDRLRQGLPEGHPAKHAPPIIDVESIEVIDPTPISDREPDR